ncbi:MAG: hypothetical protein HY533_01645 [Chloroflexi bacterium]|nr:hypothetical protein [Chloroflexota bacterium]
MSISPCFYLRGDVELTEEREHHIVDRHPDFLPAHRRLLDETLAHPDSVWISGRFANARLFARWYNELSGGKYVVVVVVSDISPSRHWIITAYIVRNLVSGVLEWERT